MYVESREDNPKNVITLSVLLGFAILFVVVGLFTWNVIKKRADRYQFYRHNEQGNSYFRNRQYQETIAEYSEMIRIDPKKAEGYYLRGNAYYMTMRYTRAVPDYTKAIALEKRKIVLGDLYYCRGNSYSASHDYTAAVADSTEAIRLNPAMKSVYEMRARMYFALKNYAAAMADCNTTIKQEPPRETVYCLRGAIFAAVGYKNRAEQDFKNAISLNPAYEEAYRELADIYESEKSFGKAVSLYQQAVLMDRRNATSWGSLGWDEYLAGDIAGAIRDLKKALALNNMLAVPEYNLGLCYAVKGDWPQAREEYQHALTLGNSDDRDAGLVNIQNALDWQPKSIALQQARTMLKAHTGPLTAHH